MKALVKTQAGPGLELMDVPMPEVGPNDVLIKIHKTAICGTDLHIWNWDKWAQQTIPVGMHVGHEFCGVIESVGSSVTEYKPGEIVSGEGHIVCGHCRSCRSGQKHLCPNTKGVGVILAYLWKEIPFIIYFVIALMANINEKLGEAAINLGAGRWTAFCKITLPLCKDAVISGFLIIFVFALGAYELPFLLGATSPKALPVLAYQQYIHPDLRNRPYSMALNGIIIVLSVLSAWIYYFIMRKNMKALTEQ